MPDKSRKSSQARYQRKRAARQKLFERTGAVPESTQTEGTAKVTGVPASPAQTQVAGGFSVGNELRKISILGGSLIVILIIASIIIRYAIND